MIISATSSEVGTILHSNNELQYLLGYKPSEIVGRNIDIIMPRPIGLIHNSMIKQYFSTAKSRILNLKR